MWPNLQETADLVTFTEEILNGKLHFLCRENTFAQLLLDFLKQYLVRLQLQQNFQDTLTQINIYLNLISIYHHHLLEFHDRIKRTCHHTINEIRYLF